MSKPERYKGAEGFQAGTFADVIKKVDYWIRDMGSSLIVEQVQYHSVYMVGKEQTYLSHNVLIIYSVDL